MRDTTGPLTQAAVERIDATQLPRFDRHHLRLLAHCLACFQSMHPCPPGGGLPGEQARREWCMAQPLIAADPGFLMQMLEQLDVAALQLEDIAAEQGVAPMALTLEQLIDVMEARCFTAASGDCDHQQKRDEADDDT